MQIQSKSRLEQNLSNPLKINNEFDQGWQQRVARQFLMSEQDYRYILSWEKIKKGENQSSERLELAS